MTKELSIENIKKEIMDKLMNNMEVLKYLEVERFLNEGYKIENLYNNFIFDYDSSHATGDYITVEVSEYDSQIGTNVNDKRYVVTIKMGLKREENVCNMASVITDIVDKIYPDRKRFSNVPFKIVDNCLSVNDYGYSPAPIVHMISLEDKRESSLHRMITFELE